MELVCALAASAYAATLMRGGCPCPVLRAAPCALRAPGLGASDAPCAGGRSECLTLYTLAYKGA